MPFQQAVDESLPATIVIGLQDSKASNEQKFYFHHKSFARNL
jgi:hypothetical protein